MEEEIRFGTDGWRAVIGQGFTEENLIRVIEAAGRAYQENLQAQGIDVRSGKAAPTLFVGHDCRKDAHHYAEIAAQVAAGQGFTVKLSNSYCPTPALCWTVAHDDEAVGGIILTSSHNPAEYLGVKLRMADGGASPKEFTDRVEELLPKSASGALGPFEETDIMAPYLEALKGCVDAEAIRAAHLRVLVDPLFGAGRGYLAGLLEGMGVEVAEIHNAEDPNFGGLHPEPIEPNVNGAMAATKEGAFDAGFVTDGDADRIAAIDDQGNYVNPHRILALLVAHLVEDKGLSGRVVSTATYSVMLARQCARLGLELTITPVGFKWIYGEMGKGDVLIGGEESGGIGIPTHVKERDGLLMTLLLAEMMAQRKKGLRELLDDMFAKTGRFEFERRGLDVSESQIERFRNETLAHYDVEEFSGKRALGIDRSDGVKLSLEGDAWVMMRPSGTEPIVRIYAEAATVEEVKQLLDTAQKVVEG